MIYCINYLQKKNDDNIRVCRRLTVVHQVNFQCHFLLGMICLNILGILPRLSDFSSLLRPSGWVRGKREQILDHPRSHTLPKFHAICLIYRSVMWNCVGLLVIPNCISCSWIPTNWTTWIIETACTVTEYSTHTFNVYNNNNQLNSPNI